MTELVLRETMEWIDLVNDHDYVIFGYCSLCGHKAEWKFEDYAPRFCSECGSKAKEISLYVESK